ncbi:hypothetical protein D3C86_1307300 [compost metagenome]
MSESKTSSDFTFLNLSFCKEAYSANFSFKALLTSTIAPLTDDIPLLPPWLGAGGKLELPNSILILLLGIPVMSWAIFCMPVPVPVPISVIAVCTVMTPFFCILIAALAFPRPAFHIPTAIPYPIFQSPSEV